MSSASQYFAERFPWLTRMRAMGGAFAVALLIVFIWPHAHLIYEFILLTAIPGTVGAIVYGLTFWPKARVQIGRWKLRYKQVRRIAGVVALACLPFLLMQRASIYLRRPQPVAAVAAKAEPGYLLSYYAIAHLEGDDGQRVEKRLFTALKGLDPRFHVVPLILNRTIPLSGHAQGFQHLEAVASIRDERVGTLLWGGVKGAASPAVGPLFTTNLFYDSQFGGAYLPVDFKLPELPIDDLSMVVQLIVATEAGRTMEEWGYTLGDALEPVIKQARAMASDPRRSSGWSGDTRARINLAIGVALKTSAFELKSEDSYHQAITYFQATQADWTREKNPLEWAIVQQNIGSALSELSEIGLQPALLKDALTSLQNALAVYQAQSDQIDSAYVQYRMGNTYREIASHEPGTDSLHRAVECYQATIKGFDVKHYPLIWAGANVQLGSTLTTLADREGNAKGFEDAIATFRLALTVYNWDAYPSQWVDTQVQLAEAFQLLGQERSNVDDLKQAVAICRQVLEGFPRDRDPRRWAATQATLGNVLLTLNDVHLDPSYPPQAVAAFRASLEEQSREHQPIAWATLKASLGNALTAVGENGTSTYEFEQAIDAFNDALEVFKPDRNPVEWARAKGDLADALSDLGERGSGIRYLTEAVDDYHQALTVLTKDKMPDDWNKTQHNLDIALRELKERGWNGS
jgi:tetratricopeptide (TPR) repeat protein